MQNSPMLATSYNTSQTNTRRRIITNTFFQRNKHNNFFNFGQHLPLLFTPNNVNQENSDKRLEGQDPIQNIDRIRNFTTTTKFLPRFSRARFTGIQHDLIKLTDFRQFHKIGEGSYSIVKLFIKDNKKYACKIFKKPLQKQILENIKNQISVLKKVVHKNIVRLHYTFQDTNHLYIVLEYIEGKSLAGFLKRTPTENQVKDVFRQLCQAVDCLHKNFIAHRDIKLDNVMIDNSTNRVVLIDFGFSTTCYSKLKMFCGTPSYMSPEIVKRQWYSGIKSDAWALGIILYKMLTGKFPFKGASEIEVFARICKAKVEEISGCSFQANTLVRGLLNKSQGSRLKPTDALNSRWLIINRSQSM